MISLHLNQCVKPCAKLRVNLVQFFVQKTCSKTFTHFIASYIDHFSPLSHLLLNNFFAPVLIKAFPLLHNPYHYYYDLYKYNNINN